MANNPNITPGAGAGEVVLTVDTANSSHSLISKPIKVTNPPPPPKDLYKEPKPKDRDALVNELDTPVRFPHWIKSLLWFVFGSAALLLPALFIFLGSPRAEYWGLTPTSPVKGGIFSASLLTGIFFAFYMGTLTVVALLTFFIRVAESTLSTRLLGARTRSGFKHFLMIRRSFARLAAIIPTWTLSQWFVVLPVWAPQLFTAVLACFTLLLVKDVIIQRVAIRYHATYHEKRIQTNKLALKCMKLLRKQYIPSYRTRFAFGERSGSPDNAEDNSDDYQADSKTMTTARVEEMSGMLFKEIATAAGKEELKPEDLYEVLGKPDADAFFKYLDTDGNGDLTRKEFIQGIAFVYQDRDLLMKTLAESDDVISRLDWFVTNAFMVIAAVVCLYIFNISESVMMFLSANIYIIIHFFFDDLFTEAFVSIVFVFVTHPFDTGDCVLIDNNMFYVRKIGLWYSSFYGKGRKLVYRRNAELCNTTIVNITRSGAMAEEFNTVLSAVTSSKQLLALEERMSKFMRANPREFEGITYVKNIRLANSEAITIAMEFRHKSNHSESSVKSRRNVLFMSFFKDSLQLLDIKLAPYSYDLPFSPIVP